MNLSAFEKRWLNHFAAGVSEENIKKFVVSTGNYIWHVFSWKLIPEESYLVGEKARQAYDGADKTGAIYVKPFEKKIGKPLEKGYETAECLDAFTEVYVVGEDFSWTYIKTHENDMCGPYFCQKNEGLGDK